jgi:hypothetical protein
MLHVDIYLPTLEKDYEFNVNEHVRIRVLIDEIASILSTKEQLAFCPDTSGLNLCDATGGVFLPDEKTLYQCRVRPGSRLILL